MAGINFPYYCSLNDVNDELLNLTVAISPTGKLNRSRKRTFISHAFSEINSALGVGGYDLPVTNSVNQLITGAVTKKDDTIDITVEDGTEYSVAKTVRIHGVSNSQYSSEFVSIVAIATNVLTIDFARNDYDASSSCEQCSNGFLHLRSCNTLGAAYRALNSLAISNPDLSDKAGEMKETYEMCLADIKDGNILLDGLSKGGDFIETLQTNDSDENNIIFKISGDENIF